MIEISVFHVVLMYFWGAVWQKATGWPIIAQNIKNDEITWCIYRD
jgi:uncharacterized membrane protein